LVVCSLLLAWYNMPFVSDEEATSLPDLIVEGVDEGMVNGAKAVRGYVDE